MVELPPYLGIQHTPGIVSHIDLFLGKTDHPFILDILLLLELKYAELYGLPLLPLKMACRHLED
jgi:hypothetical protein